MANIDLTSLVDFPVDAIGGAEKIPVADGTTPGHVTPDTLSAYIIDDIEAIAAAVATTAADSVYILQGGVLKPVAIDTLATYVRTQYTTKWLPAFNTQTSETDGVDTGTVEYPTNDNTHFAILADGLAQNESFEWNDVFLPGWDRSVIKAKVYWAPGDAAANADEWVRFMLSAGAFSNDDGLDTALGGAVNIDDQVIADDDLHITAASGEITVGGTPALGDLLHFKITRDWDYDGGATAMDVDCRIFGVLIQYKLTNDVAAW